MGGAGQRSVLSRVRTGAARGAGWSVRQGMALWLGGHRRCGRMSVLTRSASTARCGPGRGLFEGGDPIPATILRIRENARNAQEDIDRLRGTPQFGEDDDAAYLGAAWAALPTMTASRIRPGPGVLQWWGAERQGQSVRRLRYWRSPACRADRPSTQLPDAPEIST